MEYAKESPEIAINLLFVVCVMSSPPKPSSSPPAASSTAEEEARDTRAPSANVDAGRNDDEDGDSEEENIFVPRKYDVLFGRGRPLQDHPGNLRFHRIVNRARASYISARKEDKIGIARDVMNEIKVSKENPEGKDDPKKKSSDNDDDDDVNSPSSGGEPGRFLKKVSNINAPEKEVYWVEVSDPLAIEKISHALRGRPRSETRNRSDSSGSGKNVGGDRSRSRTVSARRRDSKSNDQDPSSSTSKRKGPPSPPTDEKQPDATGGAIKLTTDSSSNVPTSSNTADSRNIYNPFLASSPPVQGTHDSIHLQTMAAALNLQQIAMELQQRNAQQILQQQFQQQNAQQILQQQMIQQLLNQQPPMVASGVGPTATASPFGQNQQSLQSSEIISALLALQPQLLLQQQQQAMPLLQQQAMQLLQQQAMQLLQQQLQQNQLQPTQQSQSQQPMPSTAETPQQPTRATTSSSPGITSGLDIGTDLLSRIQEAAGSNSVNPNAMLGSYPAVPAQQPPGVPTQIQPTTVPQPGSGPVEQQFQQLQQYFLQQILQQPQALLTALNPDQSVPPSRATIPTSASSPTMPTTQPEQQFQHLQNYFLQMLQQPQALSAALNAQSASQNVTTNPNSSSSTVDTSQKPPEASGEKPPPSNKPS